MERILAVSPASHRGLLLERPHRHRSHGRHSQARPAHPRDISIIGYDDILLSSYTQPALTTLRISRTEIAGTAFRSLFGQRGKSVAEAAVKQTHVISPELMERDSTGPVQRKRRR